MTLNEINKKCEEINAVDLYVNQGMTGDEIRQLLGLKGRSQIYSYLISKGVPRRRAKRRPCLRDTPPIGKQFGIWTVISDEIKVGTNRALYWYCLCKCGHTAWKLPRHLKNGQSTRCKNCGIKSYFTEDGNKEINALILSKFKQIVQNLSSRKK